MVLMKPGCWHDTVFSDRSWPEDQWLEYGAVVTGGSVRAAKAVHMRPRIDHDVLRQIKQYLEMKQNVSD